MDLNDFTGRAKYLELYNRGEVPSAEGYDFENTQDRAIFLMSYKPSQKKPVIPTKNLDYLDPIPNASNKIDTRINYLRKMIKGEVTVEPGQIDIISKPCSINSLVKSIGGVYDRIAGGQYGSIMKVCLDRSCDYDFILKETKYNDDEAFVNVYNPYRFENAEPKILKLLNRLLVSKITPHIPVYGGNFRCKIKRDYYQYLITEIYESDVGKYLKNHKDTNLDDILRVIIFQVLYTMITIQEKYPTFMHNDLNINNILYNMGSNDGYYKYIYNNVEYNVPDIIRVGIWDYGLSSITGQDINNVTTEFIGRNNYELQSEFNQFKDMFFFLLLVKEYVKKHILGEETLMFLNKYTDNIPSKEFRMVGNTVYFTLNEILNDQYFDLLRSPREDIPIEIYNNQNVYQEIGVLEEIREDEGTFICSDYKDLYYVIYKNEQYNNQDRVKCNRNKDNYVSSFDQLNDYIPIFNDILDTNPERREEIISTYNQMYSEYIDRMYVPMGVRRKMGIIIMDKILFSLLGERKVFMETYFRYIPPKQAFDLIVQFNQYLTNYQ